MVKLLDMFLKLRVGGCSDSMGCSTGLSPPWGSFRRRNSFRLCLSAVDSTAASVSCTSSSMLRQATCADWNRHFCQGWCSAPDSVIAWDLKASQRHPLPQIPIMRKPFLPSLPRP